MKQQKGGAARLTVLRGRVCETRGEQADAPRTLIGLSVWVWPAYPTADGRPIAAMFWSPRFCRPWEKENAS